MSAKATAGLIAAVLVALVACAGGVDSGGADAQKKPAEPVAVAAVPPDIKPGARVQFLTPSVGSITSDDARAPKVAKVHGHWVYFEGEIWTSAPSKLNFGVV